MQKKYLSEWWSLNQTMIKALFFDIGGVIINTDFDGLYKKFAGKLGVDLEWADRIHKEHIRELLDGRMLAKEFLAIFQRQSNYPGDILELWKETGREYVIVNKVLLNYIDSIRGKITVAILSNLSEVRGIIDEEFGIYEHFDHLFLSYRLKMTKPHREFYKHAFKLLDIRPGEAVFVDDKPRNLALSEELGFYPVLFKDNKNLFSQLKDLGISA
jgi:FMN phosphatase YigB (HAD superfamily)